jgi:hypothetical protein
MKTLREYIDQLDEISRDEVNEGWKEWKQRFAASAEETDKKRAVEYIDKLIRQTKSNSLDFEASLEAGNFDSIALAETVHKLSDPLLTELYEELYIELKHLPQMHILGSRKNSDAAHSKRILALLIKLKSRLVELINSNQPSEKSKISAPVKSAQPTQSVKPAQPVKSPEPRGRIEPVFDLEETVEEDPIARIEKLVKYK